MKLQVLALFGFVAAVAYGTPTHQQDIAGQSGGEVVRRGEGGGPLNLSSLSLCAQQCFKVAQQDIICISDDVGESPGASQAKCACGSQDFAWGFAGCLSAKCPQSYSENVNATTAKCAEITGEQVKITFPTTPPPPNPTGKGGSPGTNTNPTTNTTTTTNNTTNTNPAKSGYDHPSGPASLPSTAAKLVITTAALYAAGTFFSFM